MKNQLPKTRKQLIVRSFLFEMFTYLINNIFYRNLPINTNQYNIVINYYLSEAYY